MPGFYGVDAKQKAVRQFRLRAQCDGPAREVFFEPGTLRPHVDHRRSIGKPRARWLVTCQYAYPQIILHLIFDINNWPQKIYGLTTVIPKKAWPTEHRQNLDAASSPFSIAANSGDDRRKVGGLVLGVCKAESVLDEIFVLHSFSCVSPPEVTLLVNRHTYISHTVSHNIVYYGII